MAASKIYYPDDIYQESDLKRQLPEDNKQLSVTEYDRRSPFARDVARVMHSAALRALADKTQVVSPRENLSPRTRLTHSIEVSQIGRSLAVGIGCDSDLVELAGFAHDIGHPPFGHNGEKALAQIMQDFGGFEANAQNLRVLTNLEPKVLLKDGTSIGLNLTRASLDACIKYPWVRGHSSDMLGVSQDYTFSKYGAYESDREILVWVRQGAPDLRVCLEAQVMNWADDIAYSVHDIEDGVLSGRVDLRVLSRSDEIAGISQLTRKFYSGASDIEQEEILAAADRLSRLAIFRNIIDNDGSLIQITALKRLTTELVGRFVTATIAVTIRDYGQSQHGRYEANIVVPQDILAEVTLLKTLALEFIMTNPVHVRKQAREREVIGQLWEKICKDPRKYLSLRYLELLEIASDDTAYMRTLCDFISSLTETHVYRLMYKKLD